MPAHRSECAIAQVLRYAWIVEDRSLHYAGREDYLIASWIVVGLMSVSDQEPRQCHACTRVGTTNIDCICRHSPFISIRRFTQSRPVALYGELGNGKRVSEEGRAVDVDSCIVFLKGNRVADIRTFLRVAYLLYNVMD